MANEFLGSFNEGLSTATGLLEDVGKASGEVTGLISNLAGTVISLTGELGVAGEAVKGFLDSVKAVADGMLEVVNVAVEVGGKLAEFGGKVIEATAAMASWIAGQASAQEDFKRNLQSILGQGVGGRLFQQILDYAPLARGTQEQFLRQAQLLITNPAFRPNTAQGELEFGRLTGLLGDIQAGGASRNAMDQIVRILAGGERLSTRNQQGFSQAGLPIEEVGRQFNMTGEQFAHALRTGAVSQIDFIHALERMDVALRHTRELGEYAITVGANSLGGIILNLSNAPQQIFARWYNAMDTTNDATHRGSEGLSTLRDVLHTINDVLANTNGNYPEVFQRINHIISSVVDNLFGSLGHLDVLGVIQDTLQWIDERGVPIFITVKNSAIAFFEGIWAGIQPLLHLLGFGLTQNGQSTEETFRAMGVQFGTVISNMAEGLIRIVPLIMSMADGISRFGSIVSSVIEFLNDINPFSGFSSLAPYTPNYGNETDVGGSSLSGRATLDLLNNVAGNIAASHDATTHLANTLVSFLQSPVVATSSDAALGHIPGHGGTGSHSGGGGSTSIVSNQHYVVSPNAFNIHVDVHGGNSRDEDFANQIGTEAARIALTQLEASIERTFIHGSV